MNTAIYATLISIAFFVALLFVYRLFRACAELRRLLLAEYGRRKQLMDLLHQYATDNDCLCKTRDALRATLEQMRRDEWSREPED